MAEVGIAIAIAGEESDAVRGEVVEGVGDLRQGGLGVQERGKGGEETVGGGIFLLERCAVLVAVAG